MASVDLLFGIAGPYAPPAGGSVHLVLGDEYGAVGALTDLALNAALRLAVAVTVASGVLMPAAPARAAWNAAATAPQARAAEPWGAFAGTQPGRAPRLPWAPGGASTPAAPVSVPWGAAGPAPAATPRAAWGAASPLSAAPRVPWGSAQPAQRHAALPWRAATPALAGARAPWQAAVPLLRALLAPWGAASPLPGVNRPLPVAPGNPGNVQPTGQAVNLHFCTPLASQSLHLVFGGEVCITQPRIPLGQAIAARSAYVTTHSITAYRLPELTPVPLEAFTLQADAEAFGWSLQATGTEAVRSLLEPVPGAAPHGLRLVVDGMTFEFVVEAVRRQRTFTGDETVISARSATALLGEPYLPPSAFLNSVPMTAQQLVEEALAYTGATLSWQVTDWLVPAGAWSVTATPLAAALTVAASIGAVVQSARAADELVILPRYPVMPWAWAGVTPDVTIAAEALDTEGYERTDRPAYEGVYVSGQAQGVLALVKRTGTAPALLMPLVTDPLITGNDAARQRGESLLGAAGPQARMTETIPVLTGVGEPGIVDVGRFARVLDPAGAWTGLVRGVSVRYDGGWMDQTLTIERHL